MKLPVYNHDGGKTKERELPKVFDVKVNRDVVHQVVSAQAANNRVPVAHARGRSEVRGGGKKPWRQKGTGRARHGSIRSPLWKGGGVTHGPTKERRFSKKVNKKMASLALRMVIGEKARIGALVLVEGEIASGKTRDASRVLKNLASASELKGIDKKTAIVVIPEAEISEARAWRNLDRVETEPLRLVTAHDILSHAFIIMQSNALDALGERLK